MSTGQAAPDILGNINNPDSGVKNKNKKKDAGQIVTIGPDLTEKNQRTVDITDSRPSGTLPGKVTDEYENAVAAQISQRKEKERREKSFGFLNTVLTSPFGVTKSAFTAGKKKLYGA